MTSVTTICRAPTWRQTAAAMMPMGPAPVISTSSPTRSKDKRGVHRIAERIENGADLVIHFRRQVNGIEGRNLADIPQRRRAH